MKVVARDEIDEDRFDEEEEKEGWSAKVEDGESSRSGQERGESVRLLFPVMTGVTGLPKS